MFSMCAAIFAPSPSKDIPTPAPIKQSSTSVIDESPDSKALPIVEPEIIEEPVVLTEEEQLRVLAEELLVADVQLSIGLQEIRLTELRKSIKDEELLKRIDARLSELVDLVKAKEEKLEAQRIQREERFEAQRIQDEVKAKEKLGREFAGAMGIIGGFEVDKKSLDVTAKYEESVTIYFIYRAVNAFGTTAVNSYYAKMNWDMTEAIEESDTFLRFEK